jgi:hypothetical protein
MPLGDWYNCTTNTGWVIGQMSASPLFVPGTTALPLEPRVYPYAFLYVKVKIQKIQQSLNSYHG